MRCLAVDRESKLQVLEPLRAHAEALAPGSPTPRPAGALRAWNNSPSIQLIVHVAVAAVGARARDRGRNMPSAIAMIAAEALYRMHPLDHGEGLVLKAPIPCPETPADHAAGTSESMNAPTAPMQCEKRVMSRTPFLQHQTPPCMPPLG
jgi:hypothetical protein